MPVAVVKITSYPGPSIWGTFPVTCVALHVGDSDSRSDIAANLTYVLHSLSKADNPNAPLPLLPWPGQAKWQELFGWLAVNLLRRAGGAVEISTVWPNSDSSSFTVAVEAVSEKTGVMAANLSAKILNNVNSVEDFTDKMVIPSFLRLTSRMTSDLPSIHSRPIVSAARLRGIPVTVSDSGSFLELGNGQFRHRLAGSVTSMTPHLGFELCNDKHLTNLFLRAAGIPAPDCRVVRDPDQAVAVAQALGFPVVLKPRRGADSDGVYVGLDDALEVRRAFDAASGLGVPLVIEPFVRGREYRATLVDGGVVALIERVSPRITGDGERTVQELIDLLNTDTRRGTHTFDSLKSVVVDAKTIGMLEKQGVDLESVPMRGQILVLKPTGHVSAGGAAVDRTDEVHPDNADLLRQVTRVFDIDVAGIDFIIDGAISQSIWEVGGAIIEVNSGPGYWIHEYPAEGESRDIGTPIIDMLYPAGAPVRVPIVAITRSEHSTRLAHRVAAQLRQAGHSVGLAAADGLFVNQTHLRFSDPLETWSARKILNHPAVEIAVIEVRPEEILERGLPFDYCDVAVVTEERGLEAPEFDPAESVVCRVAVPAGHLFVSEAATRVLRVARDVAAALTVITNESDGDLPNRIVDALTMSSDPGHDA